MGYLRFFWGYEKFLLAGENWPQIWIQLPQKYIVRLVCWITELWGFWHCGARRLWGYGVMELEHDDVYPHRSINYDYLTSQMSITVGEWVLRLWHSRGWGFTELRSYEVFRGINDISERWGFLSFILEDIKNSVLLKTSDLNSTTSKMYSKTGRLVYGVIRFTVLWGYEDVRLRCCGFIW